MRDHRSEFSVERMAKVLDVSKSGFYAWLARPESPRAKAQRLLDARVRAAFQAHKARYGSTKIARYLAGQGYPCSRTRVARSMRRQGLRSKVARKFRVTTDSNHTLAASPNLLDRNFDIGQPNKVWASDITYLPSKSGWLYLAVFIDLFSRRIVGWCVSTSLRHEMVLHALSRAVAARRPPQGLMIHSDRGIQYCCEGFREKIAEYGFVQSMSRKGNCWDNAVSESLFRSLKTEWAYHIDLDDLGHAQRELFEYIEAFYNNQRLHATLGYLSPAAFELRDVA
jgi:transposase InsO family protein